MKTVVSESKLWERGVPDVATAYGLCVNRISSALSHKGEGESLTTIASKSLPPRSRSSLPFSSAGSNDLARSRLRFE